MEKRKTIWDLGIELGQKRNAYRIKRTLLFVGGKQSGKTSLIYRFLERKEEPKPTLALDYFFAQRQRTDETKSFSCDIWEIGEATNLLNLLPFIIREGNLESLSIILVVDLSRPKELVTISETLLSCISEQVEAIIHKLPNLRRGSLMKERDQRFGGNVMVVKNIRKTLPIPITIVGNKYDLFQEMESEERKLINRYLCCITNHYGCSLVYISIKRDQLLNRFKTILTAQAYNLPKDFEESKVDHGKPFWLPFGAETSDLMDGETWESLRAVVEKRWPQITSDIVIPDDPAKDENFRERDIDIIRAQRDEELENYRRRMELRKENIIIH